MIIEYEKMITKTIMFYEKMLGLPVDMNNIDEYVHSLTLPGYAKVFMDVYQMNIIDNDNLATLGDSVLGLCICKYFYDNDSSTKKGMISDMKKRLGCNEFLNEIGENILNLDRYLFKIKRDLDCYKAYATAVESIMGCIFTQYGLDASMDFFVENILNYMK